VKTLNNTLISDDGNIRKAVFVEAKGLPLEYKRYTIPDILMMKYSSAGDSKIVNDHKGQYYILRKTQNELIIETIKEIEEIYVSYTIYLPDGLYGDTNYEDIINNIDIIE